MERLWIDKVYNKLPKLFEAIILSGMPEQSNSPNVGSSTPAEIQELNDNRYYFVRVRPLKSAELVLPNPFYAPDLKDAKWLINMHPLAYIEVNKSEHPPTHGDIYECRLSGKNKGIIILNRRLRNSGFKIGKIANRNLHKAYDNQSPMQMQPMQEAPSDGAFSNPWGLKPKKGVYQGRFPPGAGTNVLNGYPVYGTALLQIPDSRFWKLKGGGNGAILKDFIGDFNRMCEHFFNDFGKKFRCSGIRDFKTQIYVRKRSVNRGGCPSMTVGGCSTAVPGSSNHGWGQAVDIKSVTRGTKLRWSDPEYRWMVDNAATYGWYHPFWAQKPDGTKGKGIQPEPWHWEPRNKVIKVLK
jgi:hypothetical protein